jgi:hypothetical protein
MHAVHIASLQFVFNDVLRLTQCVRLPARLVPSHSALLLPLFLSPAEGQVFPKLLSAHCTLACIFFT